MHAGYARTFTPAQPELIASPVLERFVGTTNAPFSLENGLPRPERAHRFDLGVSQRITPAWTVGVDAYYKDVRDLLDFGQFGGALIFTPINYRQGQVYGVEFSTTWRADPVLLYGNLALSRSVGRDIRSAQFNFEPEELEYIREQVRPHGPRPAHHRQRRRGVAGLGGRAPVRLHALRQRPAEGLRQHGEAGALRDLQFGVQQDLSLAGWRASGRVRFDVLNVFDREYQLRDGTGIGVGAPQFGARRGFFARVEPGVLTTRRDPAYAPRSGTGEDGMAAAAAARPAS